MKIITKPSELVELNIFNLFASRICKNNEEAKKLLLENKEFELSLHDAFVMEFITCLPTDKLIYRFNLEMLEFIGNRSSLQKFKTSETDITGDPVMESKGVMLISLLNKLIEDYVNTKYPAYWTPPINYKVNLDLLKEHINWVKEELSKRERFTIMMMNKKIEVYKVDDIKKLFDFKH